LPYLHYTFDCGLKLFMFEAGAGFYILLTSRPKRIFRIDDQIKNCGRPKYRLISF
jgi:hypothetical protein